VLKVGLDPPQRGEGPSFKFGDTPHIFGTAGARDLKFCVHMEGGGPNKNYAKVCHRGSGAESRDLTLNIGPPPIFGTADARDLKFCMHTEEWGP